jgi:HEAT repeat protein
MARTRSTDARLAKLRLLQNAPRSPSLLHDLQIALADSSNLVAAEAATIIGEGRFMELGPDLVAAFERFLDDPVKTDKLCRAKIAIAEALTQIDHADEEILWRGARHVQPEPVWGGSQDTAAPLRVTCAFALVRLHAHGVMPFLVDLLNDPEKPARIGAAQALAYAATEAAGLLLRLKARLGDPEPEVIAECFDGLVKLSPAEGVAFVEEFLRAPDLAVQEAAVLALGSSRRPEAFAILQRYAATEPDPRMQETVFLAVSLLRLPEATDYLLAQVAAGEETRARAAVAALALHHYDERIRERTAAAVAQSGQAALAAFFQRRFRLTGTSEAADPPGDEIPPPGGLEPTR